MAQKNWEAAWSHEMQRYYYFDRFVGTSQWLKPNEFKGPYPEKEEPDDAPIPPLGWKVAKDTRHNRWYYYNEKEKDRVWIMPKDVGGDVALAWREIGGRKNFKNSLADIVWDPTAFLECLNEAKVSKDPDYRKKIYADVYQSNFFFLSTERIESLAHYSIPATVRVDFKEVTQALKQGSLKGHSSMPKVWITKMNAVSAALALLEQDDTQRHICVVSFCNGEKPGGGYTTGGRGQEEELCRRIPALYDSLNEAKKQNLYPFGPSTAVKAGGAPVADSLASHVQMKAFCDVLFTPHLEVVRKEEDQGYDIYPPKRHRISVLSSAPPDLQKIDREIAAEPKLLTGAMTSMFVAPLLRDPSITCLVVGAWGVYPQELSPSAVAKLLAKAIAHELSGYSGVRLGYFYKEIIVAVPSLKEMKDEDEDDGEVELYDQFSTVLQSTEYGIQVKEMFPKA